jgi:hypothetical protein
MTMISTSKIPWFLTCVFALLSVVGWWKALQSIEKKGIDEVERKEIIREIISKQPKFSAPNKEDISQVLDKDTLQVCLENAQVRQRIDDQAKDLAVEISNQVLENYKEEEQAKEEEQVQEYMNNMEDFFSNAVNLYSEEFDIKADVSEQLHLIIEQGFEKQRNLYQQKSNGDFTEEEYEKFRHESRMEGRQAVRELLGEDGSRDFGKILREEGRRTREEKFNSSE